MNFFSLNFSRLIWVACVFIMLALVSCNNSKFIIVEGWEEINMSDCPEFPAGNYRIDSQGSWDSLINQLVVNGQCLNVPNFTIDFELNTMLGISHSYTGCNFISKPSLSVDPSSQQYIYELNITTDGTCNEDHIATAFIATSKIPSNYIVNFSYSKN